MRAEFGNADRHAIANRVLHHAAPLASEGRFLHFVARGRMAASAVFVLEQMPVSHDSLLILESSSPVFCPPLHLAW